MKKKDLIKEVTTNVEEIDEAVFNVDPKNTQSGDVDTQISDIETRPDFDPQKDKIEVSIKTESKVFKKSQIMEMKRAKLYENTIKLTKKELLEKLIK